MFSNGTPNGPQNKDQMDPQDLKNLFMFFIIAALLYFAYDSFILKPQTRALEQRYQAESALAKMDGPSAEKALLLAKPLDRKAALADTGARLPYDNGAVFGTIALKGGRLDDASLHEYFKTLDNKDSVNVLSPRGALGARSIEYGWVAGQDSGLKNVPGPNTPWQVAGINTKLTKDTPVTLQWDGGEGVIFQRTFQMDDNYMFTVTQRAINNSGRSVTLYPYALLTQKGIPADYQATWISHEGPIGFIGEDLINPSYSALRKESKQDFTATRGWLGITDKYWLSALIPPQGQNVKYTLNFTGDTKDKDNLGVYQADYLADAVTLASGESKDVQSRMFIGAKKVLMLKDYEENLDIHNLELAVDFGWFWFMTQPFFYAMHYLGLFTGNMGIAIIILTFAIRFMVFPLTNISYRSFAKMKKIGPQVAELREQYGEDKQGMQQALIQLYQREKVNPVSGCFPIILQIPILFALYKTFFVTIEIRHAPFFGWIDDLSAPDPTSIFNLFGVIPWDPPSVLQIGIWPCLMLVGMIIQKKLNPPPTDQIQKDLANYMPFFFVYIMAQFAAGLVVYWTFSAFIGIAQQIFIMKSMNVPIHLFGETEKEDEFLDTKTLAKIAEQDAEDALFDDEEDGAVPPPKNIKPPKPKKKSPAAKKKKK